MLCDSLSCLSNMHTVNEMESVLFLQISPFPFDLVRRELDHYPNADLVWAQEEPKNMGAWFYVQPRVGTACSRGRQIRWEEKGKGKGWGGRGEGEGEGEGRGREGRGRERRGWKGRGGGGERGSCMNRLKVVERSIVWSVVSTQLILC